MKHLSNCIFFLFHFSYFYFVVTLDLFVFINIYSYAELDELLKSLQRVSGDNCNEIIVQFPLVQNYHFT